MSHELTAQAINHFCSFSTAYTLLTDISLGWARFVYKRQKSLKRPSTSCCLFIAVRSVPSCLSNSSAVFEYIGLIYIIWFTNVFFVKWASLEVCRRIAPVGGILRGFLSSLSAAIFVWRTWVIWARNRNVIIDLLVLLIPVTFFSYIPSLIQKPALTSAGGCTGVSRGTGPLALKWPYALVNLIFDTVVCSLGTYKLLNNVKGGQSRISTVLLAENVPDDANHHNRDLGAANHHLPGGMHEKHSIQPLRLDADARPLRFRLPRTRALGELRPAPAIVSTMRGMGMGGGAQADPVELSMMKIEVNTSTHVHEDESLPGMEKPDMGYP
ncbi:hypothetical protein B0H14DRAFT_2573497 [Mycena olivaceomarginata]|nr:hypothetical protein B0H14DRAFT_2573497 [Mycena olivaceomarginata]